jgi:catechol 2,3-dioxygenase-like lactoylglutathione lyase family enzyme
MQIDHINIKAPEALLERVREFYCAVLGLDEGRRPNFPSPGYWLYAAERPLVHLSVGPETTAREPSGYLDHVAFRAQGLEAFLLRLEALDIDYRCSQIPELGLTQLFFTDPVGNGLEINFVGEALP